MVSQENVGLVLRLIQLATLLGAVSPGLYSVQSGDEANKESEYDSSCSASCGSIEEDAIDELLDSLPSADTYHAALARRESTSKLFQLAGAEQMDSLKDCVRKVSNAEERDGTTGTVESCQKHSTSKVLRSLFVDRGQGGQSSSFPSLNLPAHFHHDGETTCKRRKRANGISKETRHDLEETAAAFLSRPLLVDPPPSYDRSCGLNSYVGQASEIGQVPQVLLYNIQEAFSQLLDSRLRAYASILLRHSSRLMTSRVAAGQDAEGPEEGLILLNNHKLRTLLEIASGIVLDTSVTYFRPKHISSSKQSLSSACAYSGGHVVIKTPIVMETIIDLALYGLREEAGPDREVLTVSVITEGEIEGFFISQESGEVKANPLLKKVEMKLDCHALLDSMMEQARNVGLCVVNCVNARFCAPSIEEKRDLRPQAKDIAAPTSSENCPIHEAETRGSVGSVRIAAAALLCLQQKNQYHI